MPGKIPVSAIVVTRNEEKNIARCLRSLERFDEVIVIDSDSTDKTPDIAHECGANVVQFAWNGEYPKKRQWTLDTVPIKHRHVFFIDADEEATPALCDEIAALDLQAPGYFVRGLYVVRGAVLRHGMHNKKLCLFDRTKMAFPVVDDLDMPGMGEIEGHYQPVFRDGCGGKIPTLKAAVLHYALTDPARYTSRHDGYREWQKQMQARNAYPQDPVFYRQWLKKFYRLMPGKNLFLLIYFYVIRLGLLEYKNNIAIFREKRKYHVSK